MNMNMIINMVIRRVTSIAINKGINAGVDQLAKRKGRGQALHPDSPDQQAQAKQTANRMRQGAKLTRRLGRF